MIPGLTQELIINSITVHNPKHKHAGKTLHTKLVAHTDGCLYVVSIDNVWFELCVYEVRTKFNKGYEPNELYLLVYSDSVGSAGMMYILPTSYSIKKSIYTFLDIWDVTRLQQLKALHNEK